MKIAKLMMPLGILLAVVLAVSASPVMAQPVTSPFKGDVTIDDEPAPDGSEVAAYVGDETEPRDTTTTTTGGAYEIMLFGAAGDIGEAVSFKVKEAGTEDWLDAVTDPVDPTYAEYDPQVVNLSASHGEPPPVPTIALSPESFTFSATEDGANPEAQTLQISNSGEEDSILNWEVSDDAAWLSLSPTSGTGLGDVSVSVDVTGMAADDYSATITISAEDATNSPQSVSVSLTISGTVTWDCPLDREALISPYPKHARPLLSVAVDLSEVTCDADWFQVYWLDEETGVYLYYISGYAGTLTQLEPDEFYLVVVSAPCELTIPQ